MPFYTTKYAIDLSTGKPLTIEVSSETLERFEYQKKLIEAGKAPMLGSLKHLTEIYEFAFFPAYNELLKIFQDNEFTTELMTQILRDFGMDELFIQKLIEDEDYISEIKPWFEGICCDGERASRTLKIIYDQTKCYYSPLPQPRTTFQI